MKRTFSVLLILCLVLSLLPFGALADDVPAGFEDYIPIRDYFDLYDIGRDLSANYVLVADIDMTGAFEEGGDLYNPVNAWISLGWNNVDADRVPFTGVLDGNGHTITGFQSWGESAGLFWQNDGTIRNLTIESGDVHNNSNAIALGAFCQYNAGLIENCVNGADVTAKSNANSVNINCGGIVGNNTGTIFCCSNDGMISGEHTYNASYCRVGGITGWSSGSIEKCWNSGPVSGKISRESSAANDSQVGGIAGCVTESGAVADVYNAGAIYAYRGLFTGACAGGLIGYIYSATLENGYNRGTVESNSYAGGVLGYLSSSVTLTNCFYLSDMTQGVGYVYSGTDTTRSLSDGLMKRQNSFTGFDFDETWIMGTGDYPYPVLRVPVICTHEETVLTGAVAATCTEDGYTGDEVCANCGETVSVGSVIPATGHSWGDWVITTQPTATTEGVETRTCSNCGAAETRSVPAQPENCDGGDGCPSKNFTDVDLTAYYHLPMDWAVMTGVTTGVTPTAFRPNVSCTRAQMVTFLWRAAGSPEPTLQESPFVDVGDHYYAKAVLWAVENEITTGVDPTHFMPNRTVTRAQTVTFLWRMQDKPNPTGGKSFPDVPANAYYAKAVAWAAAAGVTTGTNGRFNPNNDCTRAQIVTFLYRAIAE